jgi:hypothetical protein
MFAELIAQLCAAKGPDAQLDGRIYCALHGLTFRGVDLSGSIHFEPDARGVHTMVTPHRYTASLDMAREVVPKGFYWLAGEGRSDKRPDEPLGSALVTPPNNLAGVITAEGETAELALCVAGLHARRAAQ